MIEPTNPPRIGYCTNVHAGSTLEQLLLNLEAHVPAIQSFLDDTRPLPIGLWISRQCLDDLQRAGTQTLKARLEALQVEVFTINGFPYGNFHDQAVKKRVYQPDWSTSDRLLYTIQLARILQELVPEESDSGISTLPLGWSDMTPNHIEAATDNLIAAAASLAELESTTGTCIHLDLEPEPGCLLQRSTDVTEFFEQHLLSSAHEDVIRRHLRVCHDVCHASVMHESQSDAIKNYDHAGLSIGKVQISSALQVDGNDSRQLTELARYAEPRWLHQTCIRHDGGIEFFEDLPLALTQYPSGTPGCWRVHFHVPVHLASVGSLDTTQNELVEAITLLAKRPEITAWEVETYAWSAIPDDQQESLAISIGREISWTRQCIGGVS